MALLVFCAACGGEPRPSQPGGARGETAVTHLFDLSPAQAQVPSPGLPQALARALEVGEVTIVGETIPEVAWRLDAALAEGQRVRLRAPTRFPALGPPREVARERADDPRAGEAVPAGREAPPAPDACRIGPRGVEVAFSEEQRYPPEFAFSYRADSAALVRDLLGAVPGPGEIAAPGSLEFEHGARRAALLPPPAVAAWRVRVPAGAQLIFGYGLRALAFRDRGDGLVVHERAPEDLAGEARFVLETELEDGTCRELWSAALDAGACDRFHEARVELAPLAGRQVLLRFDVRAAPGGLDQRLVPFVAEPVLDFPRAQPPPDVVVLLIDTLRADRLGCYGGDRGLSPRIDALARGGVVFEQAMSGAPQTLPSHATLFTSLYPSQHGLWYRERLAEERTTIAEVLRARGYTTLAMTEGIFVHHQFGLAQGFDVFAEGTLEVRRTVARTRPWIAGLRGPLFAFVQTYQAHAPYSPPAEERARFVRPYDGSLPESIVPHGWGNAVGEEGLSEADARYVRDLYDAEVAYTDRVLCELVDALERAGRLDNTLLIVTSDHGEELGDHGRWGHGHTLYEELLHVPLVIRWPGHFDGGGRVSHPVHLVDLAPTIARAAGAPVPEEWVGAPLGPRPPDTERPLFAPYVAPLYDVPPAALRLGTKKIIHHPVGLRHYEGDDHVMVFDLATDPHEQHDLWPPDRQCRWDGRFAELLRRYGPLGEARGAGVDAAHAAGIEHLGYTGER